MVIDRECNCPAYPWKHEFGLSDCGDRMKREAFEQTCDEWKDVIRADAAMQNERSENWNWLDSTERFPMATNIILTKAQRKALHVVWRRTNQPSYYKFRRAAVVYRDYTMVHFAGMWLGIEKDGYTHS